MSAYLHRKRGHVDIQIFEMFLGDIPFAILAFIQFFASELLLFSAIGILIFSLDDALFDLAWLAGFGRAKSKHFIPPSRNLIGSKHYAVMIPAWQEANVLEATVTRILALWGRDSVPYRLYLGCYPNDPLTIFAASRLANMDDRVRIVIHPDMGHSTKADCLNMIWREIIAQEQRDGSRISGIILQDAEDVVHADALSLMVDQSANYDLVQLPVRPILDSNAHFVSAHYADEFAEMHEKDLRVRQALGAVVPAAGVGFLLTRAIIDRIIAAQGMIFSPDSLTEDYELAYRVAECGGQIGFCAQRDRHGETIATACAYPNDMWQSVRQKARWINGIALGGWDRLGWPAHKAKQSFVQRCIAAWMLWRDRRVVLNAVIIFAAYASVLLMAFGALLAWITPPVTDSLSATAIAFGPSLTAILWLNAALFVWRLVVRAVMTGRIYGWRTGLWAIPRAIISNFIMILSVRRAVANYGKPRNGTLPFWDKTDHAALPVVAPAAQRSKQVGRLSQGMQ